MKNRYRLICVTKLILRAWVNGKEGPIGMCNLSNNWWWLNHTISSKQMVDRLYVNAHPTFYMGKWTGVFSFLTGFNPGLIGFIQNQFWVSIPFPQISSLSIRFIVKNFQLLHPGLISFIQNLFWVSIKFPQISFLSITFVDRSSVFLEGDLSDKRQVIIWYAIISVSILNILQKF